MSSGLKASSVFFLVCWVTVECKTYVLDDTPGLGRVFDGIGGISGGGVRVAKCLNFSCIIHDLSPEPRSVGVM